jgi:RNA polymerase sigma-70 factor (ECF subfamily)
VSATVIAPTANETAAPSFADLYRDTVRDLYAYVATLLGDRSAAEDVVAQTYEKAYRKRRSYDRRRGDHRAWLFGIARNAALDELRRRKRTAALVTEPGRRGGRARRPVRRTLVRTALQAMDPRDRELIALKYHGGFSNAEIAAVLGTVRVERRNPPAQGHDQAPGGL